MEQLHVSTNQEALPPLSFGALWSLHDVGTIDHSLQAQPLALLWRVGTGVENSTL